MRVTIYSWDLDIVGGGGWAISMREFAELLSDHGHQVRFVHSRVDDARARGTAAGGPLLHESQWSDSDLVWIYDSPNSTAEILAHLAGRKPAIVMQPTPITAWIDRWLAHPNAWVFANSPTLEAVAARDGVQHVERVKTLPRGRRWSKWPEPPKVARDKIGLPFGVKALIRGDGTRPGTAHNHSSTPRFATSYNRAMSTGLTPAFSALDVARGIHDATGAKAIVTTWAADLFADCSWVEARPSVRPHTALTTFYTQCRVFLHGHMWESFGVQPLEAQHCGTPVVYLREPDVQEPQLSFSAIGYVTLDTAIAAGVRLVEDHAWWEHWSEKSLENATRFDLDRLWPEYDAFLREVAGCQ